MSSKNQWFTPLDAYNVGREIDKILNQTLEKYPTTAENLLGWQALLQMLGTSIKILNGAVDDLSKVKRTIIAKLS